MSHLLDSLDGLVAYICTVLLGAAEVHDQQLPSSTALNKPHLSWNARARNNWLERANSVLENYSEQLLLKHRCWIFSFSMLLLQISLKIIISNLFSYQELPKKSASHRWRCSCLPTQVPGECNLYRPEQYFC